MAPRSGSALRSRLEEVRCSAERGISALLHHRTPNRPRAFYDARLSADALWERRRRLLSEGLLITEDVAPEVHARVERGRAALEITLPVEAYQIAGVSDAPNGGYWGQGDAVLISFDGPLLGRLRPQEQLFVVGHELGHSVAHGEPPAWLDAIEPERVPLFAGSELEWMLRRAQELTADRLGLLACRDLDAVMRACVALATGLPPTVQWNANAYLEQSRRLMSLILGRGESLLGRSHPEHSVRAHAAWLFSESDVYRALTGQGPGSRALAEIDRELTRLLGLPEHLALPAAAFSSPPRAPTPPAPTPAPAPSFRAPASRPPAPPAPPAPSPVLAPASAPRLARAPLPGVRAGADELLDRGRDALRKAAGVLAGKPVVGVSRSEEQLEESVDPLRDDERELLSRFDELERRERQQQRR